MPRQWLVALLALLIVPWLIAAALYWLKSESSHAAGPGLALPKAATVSGEKQPWGRLIKTPIVISPPLDYVPSNWGPPLPVEWRFPRGSREDLKMFLSSGGLKPPQVEALLSIAHPDPAIQGLTIRPDPAFVRSMDPEYRAALYELLTELPSNERHAGAYRFHAESAEEWFRGSPISPATFDIVKPYIYRLGDFVYFADIDLVRPQISDPAELQRLAKSLFRQNTMLVRLRVDDASQISTIADYWGHGGRRTDIRPLLESIAVAGPDHPIDIGHLLPPLARQHLYRYPRITLSDLSKPTLLNCFWTAMNFFSMQPDDRFSEISYTIDRLKRDYYLVHDQFQLGDVVMFSDGAGNYFHAAVYLADGLVFGKNGTSPLSPWTILPLDQLKGFYIQHASDWNVTYYRRNDL